MLPVKILLQLIHLRKTIPSKHYLQFYRLKTLSFD